MPGLDLKQTKSTPSVVFDPDRKVLGILGESYPENSFEFYAPLFRWMDEELPGLDRLRLDVNVSYMNSSSTKCMLDLLEMLSAAHAAGKPVEVHWYWDRDNPRALDLAEEFREDCAFPFHVEVLGG